MTTDIELAQSLKRRATSANEFGESLYVKADDILTLVEALEKSEKTSEARREAIGITHKRAARERDRANAAEEALEKAQQRISQLESRTVKLPKPKNSDQGWKIDPEFINKVQDAIGYDDTCECWEGTPSMELVEAVLLAAAGIKVEAE